MYSTAGRELSLGPLYMVWSMYGPCTCRCNWV